MICGVDDFSQGKPFVRENVGLLAGGIVVLGISKVFRLGNKLQEDQELTV